ncbi:DUF418 domain-containing protein [Actinopolymorpha alba]|uniref:DUF418 domain-containing protein n=1 Tax=Actinopolymorpha alba TaxID=533267 RepID=UPI0003A3E167|nr:DUF418 domain-containing protein [Actinopolymorpha alba]
MLLLIALANGAGVFFANAPGIDTTPHGLERFYNVFLFLFVHARALPLFAIMFGYGLVQLARRQEAAGSTPGAIRAVLVRRNAWLFVFGIAHGILLYAGDILGAYGLIGIAFTLVLLQRGDRIYRIAVWYAGFGAVYILVLAVVVAVGIAGNPNAQTVAPTSAFPSMAADSYAAAVLTRLTEWPASMVTMLPLILFAWLGAWAARRRVLEEPANHRRLLRGGVMVGFGVAVLGGLPMGLLSGGFLPVDAATGTWIKVLYESSGLFGGIGYVSLFGLLALRLSKAMASPRSNVVVGALTALGQRSLSGYLFQSVAWLVLASPFVLALDEKAASPTFAAAGSAVAVWLVTVVGAYVMERCSYRGPAEILLRRLTYGRRWRGSATTSPTRS